jgi:hypothetical protein
VSASGVRAIKKDESAVSNVTDPGLAIVVCLDIGWSPSLALTRTGEEQSRACISSITVK